MARRFTCTEDGSSKFWEGASEGSSLTTRWGKVGTAGQSKTKSFASPEAAQKELDKLVHEKLGKGYIEEGGAPATVDAAAAVAPRAAIGPTGPKLGRYTQALLALLNDRKKRDTPEPSAARWLEKETRPDLRALFAALAERRSGGVSVGDFWFNTMGVSDELGGRVPKAGASDQDRDDVIHLGSTGGGDLYVTATPGTSESSKIWLIIHDEGWTDGESWSGLEDFLEDRVKTYREEQAEQGTPKSEINTDLDEYLKRPKAAAAPGTETPIAGGALTLVAIPDAKTRDRREDNISKETSHFFYGKRSSDGEWEDWHGRYAYAAIPFPVPDYGWPDKLLTLAGDRVAIVSKKKGAKARSYLLGVRGADLRLLGTLEGVVEDTFTSGDGVSLVGTVVNSHMKWAELRHVDEALDQAFAQPAGDLALA